MRLRGLLCTGLCMLLAAPAAMYAQGMNGGAGQAAPATMTPADSLNGLLTIMERQVVSAAEAMPADKYDFVPSVPGGDFKGVRSFGSQVKHLAESNYEFFQGWMVPGATAADPKTIEALKTKDDIVKALKDSYTYAHAAIGTITPENAWLAMGKPPQRATRVMLASFCAAHSMDHYGQLVEYLRMNGIIPPASRQQGS